MKEHICVDGRMRWRGAFDGLDNAVRVQRKTRWKLHRMEPGGIGCRPGRVTARTLDLVAYGERKKCCLGGRCCPIGGAMLDLVIAQQAKHIATPISLDGS